MTDIDPTLPDFVRRMLESGATLEPIELDRSGRWWHRGNLVENRKIAALFDRSVGRTDGGTWVLEVGRFTYPVAVVDTPFFVRRVVVDAAETDVADLDAEAASVTLCLSDGRELAWEVGRVTADEYGLVYSLADGFRARFDRAVYVDFVERWVTEANGAFEIAFPGCDPEPIPL